MNYSKIYEDLCIRGQTKRRLKYTEKHHIIPSCIGGKSAKKNITSLTAREHFIAHWLLVKIYKETNLVYKLASAFNYMCCYSTQNHNRNINSRLFELARISFSKHHPCKNKDIRDKISKSLIEYFESIETEERKCGCGCGQTFKCKNNSKVSILRGHPLSGPKPNPQKTSDSLTKYLSKLSKEDLRLRNKNSFGSCDHIKRGKAISASKKGVKTNQQEIVGRKYASMSDKEFKLFLSSKSNYVIKRMTNLRDKYK